MAPRGPAAQRSDFEWPRPQIQIAPPARGGPAAQRSDFEVPTTANPDRRPGRPERTCGPSPAAQRSDFEVPTTANPDRGVRLSLTLTDAALPSTAERHSPQLRFGRCI